MSTSPVRQPRVKPIRRAHLTRANDSGGRILTLTITGRKIEGFDYYFLPIPCADGAAYELRKLLQGDGETYHVLIAGPSSSCECKGFLRWGHCKHLESLTALQQANLL